MRLRGRLVASARDGDGRTLDVAMVMSSSSTVCLPPECLIVGYATIMVGYNG